jgi:uncharacterized protein (DUF488 family)
VPVRTLTHLEVEGTANPGLFTIGALAVVLDVSLDDLVRDACQATAVPDVVSAGYEGRDIDEFVEALNRHGVDLVADVRLTPLSRKPGFSKTRLAERLGEAGIGYRHLRALGNPKDNRPAFWEGRVAEGQARFRRILGGPEAAYELNELTEAVVDRKVAVLCFERDEQRCHRRVILDAVEQRLGATVSGLA